VRWGEKEEQQQMAETREKEEQQQVAKSGEKEEQQQMAETREKEEQQQETEAEKQLEQQSPTPPPTNENKERKESSRKSYNIIWSPVLVSIADLRRFHPRSWIRIPVFKKLCAYF
jgi:hypothetical protein